MKIAPREACRMLPAKVPKRLCESGRVSLPRYRWLYLMGALLIASCLNRCLSAEAQSPTKGDKNNETDGAEWSDVLLVEQPEATISYRTGWVVYEESLSKGQFVGRGWNGSGFVSFYDGRLNP